MFTESDYKLLHSLVFQPDYPGYRPTLIEAPNGDDKLDVGKRYAHVSTKYLDRLKLKIRQENEDAIKIMTKHGVKLIYPSEEQINEFKKVSHNAMINQTGKSFSAKVRDEIFSHLEDYRKGQN